MGSADVESPPPEGDVGGANNAPASTTPSIMLDGLVVFNALAFGLSFTIGVSPLLAAIAVPLLLFALFIITLTMRSEQNDAPSKRSWKCLAICYGVLFALSLACILLYYLGDVLQNPLAGIGVILIYGVCIVGMAATLIYVSVVLCLSCR